MGLLQRKHTLNLRFAAHKHFARVESAFFKWQGEGPRNNIPPSPPLRSIHAKATGAADGGGVEHLHRPAVGLSPRDGWQRNGRGLARLPWPWRGWKERNPLSDPTPRRRLPIHEGPHPSLLLPALREPPLPELGLLRLEPPPPRRLADPNVRERHPRPRPRGGLRARGWGRRAGGGASVAVQPRGDIAGRAPCWVALRASRTHPPSSFVP